MSAKVQIQISVLPQQPTQFCAVSEPQFSHLYNGTNTFRLPEETNEISRGALAKPLSLSTHSAPDSGGAGTGPPTSHSHCPGETQTIVEKMKLTDIQDPQGHACGGAAPGHPRLG